ncbi:uncharacterized protein B0H18DRAFT_1040240 [Fomitopsis serialis]|uniref:uncharacterized protein n=1 Tax=Fomitopsis serialis TaxID=139415 RepID=UPI0020080732|nr:uncharacterized protein B0H18DRAFT_1040240 [Neoantrodia serialis]KAH9915739.1 hypothetical protein B0H18DRAFT_1040240 [Neoantrodia serialis]
MCGTYRSSHLSVALIYIGNGSFVLEFYYHRSDQLFANCTKFLTPALFDIEYIVSHPMIVCGSLAFALESRTKLRVATYHLPDMISMTE